MHFALGVITEDITGYDEALEPYDVHNEYGYWYNSIGKYDWYELGGRWRGLLLVKENVEYDIGQAGAFGDNLDKRPVPEGYKWVDSSRIKDIEWKMMREINEEKALNSWNKAKEMKKEGFKNFEIYRKTGVREEYTKEDYLKRATEFTTFSILSDKHGWVEAEDLDEREIYVDKFIKEVDENYFFSIIDYHI